MERSALPCHPVVLLVDEDLDTLDMYQFGVSLEGFHAYTIRDVSNVVERCRALQPDVVVAGVEAGTHGWKVAESLKTNTATRDIPVVALIATDNADIQSRAAELHCAAVIVKPCLPHALAETLRSVLLAPPSH